MKKTTIAAFATALVSALSIAAPAHAQYKDVPLNLYSTNTNPDVNYTWDSNAFPNAGQFCVRVRNVNVKGYATVKKPNGDSIFFSATNGNPDCKKLNFSTTANAEAYGYANNPGIDSNNTGYFYLSMN